MIRKKERQNTYFMGVQTVKLRMGNFEDHIEYGIYSYSLTIILSIGLAYAFIWPYELTVAVLPIALSATLLGSLTPDIDHHNSHPHKTLRFIVPTVSSGAVLAAIFLYFDELYAAINQYILISEPIVAFGGFLIALMVYGLIRHGIMAFRPSHRGVTHTHGFNLVSSLIVFFIIGIVFSASGLTDTILYSTTALISFAFAIGFLSHQYCDDMLF